MSNHSLAFVPVDSGLYNSPELFEKGRSVDTGLLAEALIYYDRILVNVTNPHQFADLISLLIQQGLSYSRLIDLISEGTFQVYNYAFFTLPFVHDGIAELWNIQSQAMEKPNSFAELFLKTDELRNCFSNSQQMEGFCNALNGKVVEVKAAEFGKPGIDNAWHDFLDPRRNALLVQAFVDEIYQLKSLGHPPEVNATVLAIPDWEHLRHVTWNIDLNDLSKRVGQNLAFGPTLPLSGAVIANKYIWSANNLNCDLYIPGPISALVGDKLYEADHSTSKTQAKTQEVIDQLEAEVEFPDIRRLVNEGKLDFDEVLRIRKKAKNFRLWLQSESERDRNAIVAYHNEVAREAGFIKTGRKVLRLFGVMGAAVGAALTQNTAIGITAGVVAGEVLKEVVGEATKYLFDIGASLGEEWKPVIFGNWYKERIAKLLEDNPKVGK